MVLAEVHISHSDLALVRTIRERPDVTIHREFQPVRTDSKLLLFFSVEGDDLDGFEDTLDGDPTVSNPRLIADYGSQRIYRVRIQEVPAKPSRPTLAELGVQILDVRSDGEGWELQLQLPDNDALVSISGALSGRGRFVPGRNPLRRNRWRRKWTNFGLTERQRDILETAYERGYFDDPRGVTLQELAATAGIFLFGGAGPTNPAGVEATRREIPRFLTSSYRRLSFPLIKTHVVNGMGLTTC